MKIAEDSQLLSRSVEFLNGLDRVPLRLLTSANYFQKSMGVHVLHYKCYDVYIAGMLIFGTDDDDF